MRYGFDKDLIRAVGRALFDAEFLRFFNQRGKERVLHRQGVHGEAQIKRRKFVFRRHGEAPFWRRGK